jgi:hypothetical protein
MLLIANGLLPVCLLIGATSQVIAQKASDPHKPLIVAQGGGEMDSLLPSLKDSSLDSSNETLDKGSKGRMAQGHLSAGKTGQQTDSRDPPLTFEGLWAGCFLLAIGIFFF